MRVSVCAGLALCAALQMVSAGHAQPRQYWYFCDPAHAYYPTVQTCPIPWRWVEPQPGGSLATQSASIPLTPSVAAAAAPTLSKTEPSTAYRQGQADRQTWETWFNTLTGDTKSGAGYWAAHRSLPH